VSLYFYFWSCILFTRQLNTESGKINFKTRSYGTIYIFKKIFVTVFSAISFQFLAINSIQIDP